MEFQTQLKQLRLKNNFTQVELAAELDMSRQVISSYETGQRKPDIPSLILIADYFNVTIDHLVGRTKEHVSVEYLIQKYNITLESALSYLEVSLKLMSEIKN